MKHFGLVLLALCWLSSTEAYSARFVYLIDKSGTMRAHRAVLTDLIVRDLDRMSQQRFPLFRPGDQVVIWVFDGEVYEIAQFEAQPGAPSASLRMDIKSGLERMSLEGKPRLGPALIRCLETFAPPAMGELNLFIYSDGQSSISSRDAARIEQIYRRNYLNESRMAQLFFVAFGKSDVRSPTRKLMESLGGKVVAAGTERDISAAGLLPKEPPARVEVTPGQLQFSSEAVSQMIHPFAFEVRSEPSLPGLTLAAELVGDEFPPGMNVTLNPRALKEGKQFVSFVLHQAQPGLYQFYVRLSAGGGVETRDIPVELEIRPAKPDKLGVQFGTAPTAPFTFNSGSSWNDLPEFVLDLNFPRALRDRSLFIPGQGAPQVDLRIVPEPGNDRGDAQSAAIQESFPAGSERKLGELGRKVRFQARPQSDVPLGQPLSGTISIEVPPGQNLELEGPAAIIVPLRFLRPLEVSVETELIHLGEIIPGTRNITRSVQLRVSGHSENKNARIVKTGHGLAGITIVPEEFPLRSGLMTVDLELSGFENLPSGPVNGGILLVPDEGGNIQPTPITIHGRMADPATILVELENPMVAGEPLIIRARFSSGERGKIRAAIRAPSALRSFDLELTDSGSAEDGDFLANDGTYSAIFRQTEQLGSYHLRLTGEGPQNGVAEISLFAPIYFKPTGEILTGKLVKRKKGEFVELTAGIQSDFPGRISLHPEPGDPGGAVVPYVSNNFLKPGENKVNLLVGLREDTAGGAHEYPIYLVTAPIEGREAKIPLRIEISVLSFGEYFLRLAVITVLLAFSILVLIARPWQRFAKHQPARKKAVPPKQPMPEVKS